jgi:riboflavin kinase/FMN adenylyltransferase
VVIPFTRELMGVCSAEFVRLLARDLGMVALCVGGDFALGKGREGTVPALRALGIEVIAVPVVHLAGHALKISSSSIRRAIAAGVSPELAITGAVSVTGDVTLIDGHREIVQDGVAPRAAA